MPTVCLVAIPSLSLVLVFSFSVSVKCRDSYYRYCTCRLKPFLNCCIYHSRSWFLFVLSVSQYDLISFDNFHSVSYCLQFWLVHYYLASGETLSHSRCVKAISKIAWNKKKRGGVQVCKTNSCVKHDNIWCILQPVVYKCTKGKLFQFCAPQREFMLAMWLLSVPLLMHVRVLVYRVKVELKTGYFLKANQSALSP